MKKIYILLLSFAILENSFSQQWYVPGTHLLNKDGYDVLWNQDYNNDGTCSPSYNMLAPDPGLLSSNCYCNKTEAGCAAVAMGQVMWMWQWPIVYNWSLMPYAIYSTTPNVQAMTIVALLNDCGIASNISYGCNGSWTTMNDMKAALINAFDYQAVDKRVRSQYIKVADWFKLIKTEIDCKRPVIYRGGTFINNNLGDIHYFVIDGYRASDPIGWFHINFGWSGDDNGYYSLNNLIISDQNNSNYNGDQMALIGISPSYVASLLPNANITDIGTTAITGTTNLKATNEISLPASGKTLTVSNNGNLTMTAGNSITLNPGFSAAPGDVLKADVLPNISSASDCGIWIVGWPTLWTKDGYEIGTNNIHNANSFEIEVTNQIGQIIFQNSGIINNNPIVLWNGKENSQKPPFFCNIIFRNNCGEKLSNGVTIAYADPYQDPSATKSYVLNANDTLPDSVLLKKTVKSYVSETGETVYFQTDSIVIDEPIFTISPNPSKGIFNLKAIGDISNSIIEIVDMTGRKVYNAILQNKITAIDMSNYPKGTYVVRVNYKTGIFTKKIIIE